VSLHIILRRLSKFRREQAAVAFVAVILANPAHAQSMVESDQIDALNPMIVTATVEATSGRDVLSDYDYIGPEQIERAGQSSLPELLQQQRGVQVQTYGGSGSFATVNLRGTNNDQP